MTTRDERREKVNQWREANRDNLLTIEQINDLPDGTTLEIVWKGGNGPHVYRLGFVNGEPYAQIPSRPMFDQYNVIDFVGDQRFHTQVIVKGRYDDSE